MLASSFAQGGEDGGAIEVCSGDPLQGEDLQEHSKGGGQPSASSSLAAPVKRRVKTSTGCT